MESPPARIFGTFGIYRYGLAVMVMLSHFLSAQWEVVGHYAVFGFFILSGYVVSYILHFSYLPQEKGVRKYYVNRLLRMYPPYIAASLLMLAAVVYVYPNPDVRPDFLYPRGATTPVFLGWLLLTLSCMGSLIQLGFLLRPWLLVVSWSLGVELFFWSLMPYFHKHRRARLALAWFAAGYTLLMIVLSFNPPATLFVWYYTSPFAGALPFGLGLWIFLRKQKGSKPLPHWAGIAAIVTMTLLTATHYHFPGRFNIGFFLVVAINACIVLYLSRFGQRALKPVFRKIDTFMGDMAYPIFLVHAPVGLLMTGLLPQMNLHHRSLFVISVIAMTNVAALLLHLVVEIPVNRLRSRIKTSVPQS